MLRTQVNRARTLFDEPIRQMAGGQLQPPVFLHRPPVLHRLPVLHRPPVLHRLPVLPHLLGRCHASAHRQIDACIVINRNTHSMSVLHLEI